MSAKATEVVPAPPPLSPAKAKKKSSSGWDRAKSKRRASTLLMLRVKQAKEQMEKEMLTEAETIEKDKIGLKFAHIRLGQCTNRSTFSSPCCTFIGRPKKSKRYGR